MNKSIGERKGLGCLIPPSTLPYFLGGGDLEEGEGSIRMSKRKWKRFLSGKLDGMTFGLLYTMNGEEKEKREESTSRCAKKNKKARR